MLKLTPEVIRICRVSLGMSQGKLARMAGISAPLLGFIERDERKITHCVEQQIRAAIPLSDDEIRELVEVNRKINRNLVSTQ